MEAQGNHTAFTQAGSLRICATARNYPALFPAFADFPDLLSDDRNALRGRLYCMTSAGISSHVLRTLQALEPELRAAGVRHIIGRPVETG
jgi:hypothetical protein